MKHYFGKTNARKRLTRLLGTSLLGVLVILGIRSQPSYSTAPSSQLATQTTVRFAVIGDYGSAGQPEADVAALVTSWSPEFIVTTGDNNYPNGSATTIDPNIGQYYSSFIFPYTGSYSPSATLNRFFPVLGNHDWDSATANQPYLDYFSLPNNERYYDVLKSPVQLFMLDSDSREPDGITSNSVQAQWLQTRLASSTAPWKLVFLHHAPYSSSSGHGSHPVMQWPYQTWGASAVIAGHDHDYERIIRNNFPYFVNGLGGKSIYNFASTPVIGSVVRYNGDYGAMLIEASSTSITFKFIARTGIEVDSYTLNAAPVVTPTPVSTATPPTITPTTTPTIMPTTTPIPFSTWLPVVLR